MTSARSQPPWATDDQWAHVRSATGGGRAVEGGLTASGGPSRVSSSASITSLSFKQKMKPTLDANPYEGALGPTIGEGSVTASHFSRLDISKVITTPKDVWKNGKQATVPVAKPPGHQLELRAQQRSMKVPADGRPEKQGDGSEFEAPIPPRPGGYGKFRDDPGVYHSTHRSAEPSAEFGEVVEQPRSRSALGMLEGPGQNSFISETQGTVNDARIRLAESKNPLSDIEQQEVEVLNLKGQLARLQRIRSEKEDEFKRLLDKHQINDKDVEKAREVDKDLDDFRQRVEDRIAATEARMPELAQQRQALEEVVRRLKLVNKGLTWRLNQGKEEQRVYQSDLKDMGALSRDVVASKESTLQSLAELKTSMVEEKERRERDLARRQNTVEKMLRETKLQAERLKEEKVEKDKATAEKEAEEELAMIIAEQNGTAMAAELAALRARRQEEKQKEIEKGKGHVMEAMRRIMEVCKTEDADESTEFLERSTARQQKLMGMKGALQDKALVLRKELSVVEAEQARLAGGGGEEEVLLEEEEEEERRSMEGLLGDIETFAEQNRQVDEAMRELTESYLGWFVKVIAQMVAYSADDQFLRRALECAKQLRDMRANPNLLEEVVRESTELVLEGSTRMSSVVARTRTLPKQPVARADAVERVPSGTGEQITAISGNQTLKVSRGKASSTMEPLDPHPGFGN